MKKLCKDAGILLVALALCATPACTHKTERHSVTLRWNAPAGAAVVGYNIYRSTTPGMGFVQLAAGVKGTSYEDRLVTSERTYFYVITAVDGAGHESRFSDEASATVP